MSPPAKRVAAFHTERWLEHARSDLALARLGAGADVRVLPEQLCFHAQKVVEKAFKAVLVHHQVEFPFTHDSSELLDALADAGIGVSGNLAEADALTPYAVETWLSRFLGRDHRR